MTLRQAGTSHSNRSARSPFCSSLKDSGSSARKDRINGRQPSLSASMYTMPQRDTVAGEAKFRSDSSKSIRIQEERWTISPDIRHSFLLSSSTVLRFSIQAGSAGPSSTIHFLSSVVLQTQFSTSSRQSTTHLVAMSLKVVASTPSLHSCDSGSKQPYSWAIVIDLGLMMVVWTLNSCCSGIFCSARLLSVSARIV